jgi:cathepsin H
VSPVKNQAHCGSCWTFSTVGALEAHVLIKYQTFRNMSEQQLVDCAGAYDNHGCHGGLPSHAFEYIKDNQGLADEANYPYLANDGTCYYEDQMKTMEVIGGSVNITAGDEEEMMHAVFRHGPVSVAYQVIPGFKNYKEGVYHNDTCGTEPNEVNHAVLAVGYGKENDMDYWLIKNSWSSHWGDEGFFKI